MPFANVTYYNLDYLAFLLGITHEKYMYSEGMEENSQTMNSEWCAIKIKHFHVVADGRQMWSYEQDHEGILMMFVGYEFVGLKFVGSFVIWIVNN